MKLGIDADQINKDQSDLDNKLDWDDSDDSGASGGVKRHNLIIVFIVIAVIIIAAIIFFLGKSGSTTQDDEQTTQSQSAQIDPQQSMETEKETTAMPGAIDYYNNDNMKTSDTLDQVTDFLKDLQGVSIPVDYTVTEINYVRDYVNYTKRRASVDEGMELYWIDIVYNDKKYKCTIPFWRYKAMKDEGICIVEMEVLSLEGGAKVISNMVVVSSLDDK